MQRQILYFPALVLVSTRVAVRLVVARVSPARSASNQVAKRRGEDRLTDRLARVGKEDNRCHAGCLYLLLSDGYKTLQFWTTKSKFGTAAKKELRRDRVKQGSSSTSKTTLTLQQP